MLAVALGAFACDLTRQPSRQWSAAVAVGAIHGYQSMLAPVVGKAGVRCRFEPSCSRYAEAAIRKYGLAGGGWRAIRRVLRCGPWTPKGTVDLP